MLANDDAVNDDTFDDDDGDDAAATDSLISLLGPGAGAAKIASQTVVAQRGLVVLLAVAWSCSFCLPAPT